MAKPVKFAQGPDASQVRALGRTDPGRFDGIRDVGVVGVGVAKPRVEQVRFRGPPQRIGRPEPIVFDGGGLRHRP